MSNRSDIEIDFIVTDIKGQNKKMVLENLLSFLSKKVSIPKDAPLDRLLEKEEFESCAIGHGVAIPHVRVDQLKRPVTILARLEQPAEFNAGDATKVDLVCLVLSPRESGAFRLIRVSRLQRLFDDQELCQSIREARDEDTIYSLIFNPEGWVMAA